MRENQHAFSKRKSWKMDHSEKVRKRGGNARELTWLGQPWGKERSNACCSCNSLFPVYLVFISLPNWRLKMSLHCYQSRQRQDGWQINCRCNSSFCGISAWTLILVVGTIWGKHWAYRDFGQTFIKYICSKSMRKLHLLNSCPDLSFCNPVLSWRTNIKCKCVL